VSRVGGRLPKVLDRLREHLPHGDLWVFGYGSLMWNPEFVFEERAAGRVHGYHRALCIYSTRYRGTPERPGLVMGLDRGGSCHGMAFKVPARNVTETLLSLWQREMRNRTYDPRLVWVRSAHASVRALAFVVDPGHPHYAGKLAVETIAHRIASCRGVRGENSEYLHNTIAHLAALGVHDHRLISVARVLERLSRTC
jgi:cation transport protein ChaC